MVLVTYDLSGNHSQVKDAMKAKGYHDSWSVRGVSRMLPNTTVVSFAGNTVQDTDRAIADLRQCAAAYPGTTILSAAAVVVSEVSVA